MKKRTTLDLVEQSERVSLYSISFALDRTTEFELFLRKPIASGSIRLYCLRISDEILILGNGDVKRTSKYEEDSKLLGYALDLQRFDELLRKDIEDGIVIVEEKELSNIEDKENYI